MSNLLIGLEIEGVYNSGDFRSFQVGEYHDGVKNGKYWSLEDDSSIECYRNFSDEQRLEFVSKILTSKKIFLKAIKEFQDILTDKDTDLNLNEVFYINSSCGCHFHIGYKDKEKYKKYSSLLDYSILENFREDFFKSLKNNKDISKQTKESIKENYFRGYASKTTKKSYLNQNNRSKEFNKLSENQLKGFEWRSFNLNKVKSFEEIFSLLEMCYDLIHKHFYLNIKNGYEIKRTAIRFLKKPLTDLYLSYKKPQEVLIDNSKDNTEDIILILNKNQTEEIPFYPVEWET